MVSKIRFCVDGCGSHTKEPMESFFNPSHPNDDLADALVCPWCHRKQEGLSDNEKDIGMVVTGHDNRKDWIEGSKKEG